MSVSNLVKTGSLKYAFIKLLSWPPWFIWQEKTSAGLQRGWAHVLRAMAGSEHRPTAGSLRCATSLVTLLTQVRMTDRRVGIWQVWRQGARQVLHTGPQQCNGWQHQVTPGHGNKLQDKPAVSRSSFLGSPWGPTFPGGWCDRPHS
jgi:hypothetical protein